jgi:uncharacterized protein
MHGLRADDVKLILGVFQKYPDVSHVIIFGSRAMGNYKPGSDVDIAIKGNVSEETLAHISVELNERLPLPYKFDVLAYNLIDNQDLKKHIDQFGKELSH